MILFAHHPGASSIIEHNPMHIPIIVCSVGIIIFCVIQFALYKHYMDINR